MKKNRTKKINHLKRLRVLLAIFLFTPLLLCFLDFRHQLPEELVKLPHLQIIPAIMAGTTIVLIFHFLLVLLLGRIYCSVICPTGILQDIINRIYCFFSKNKKKKNHRFKYHKPNYILHYILTSIVFFLLLFGLSGLALILDPYSNFGRIASNIFQPFVIWINNLLAVLMGHFDNYTLYHVSIHTITTFSLVAGVIMLLLLIVMTVMRGRLFCNTLCPVGGLLSIFSRYSLFRIDIDKDKCVHCGLCEKKCKAEAIDSSNLSIDHSRCISCFNCISSCKKDSIHFRYKPIWKQGEKTTNNKKTVKPSLESRRSFLTTGAVVAGTLPMVSTFAQNGQQKKQIYPITPPGSFSLERFKEKCTGCQLCVVQCPSHVLRPAGLEFGLNYMLKPYMAYINSYCNYECTICSEICPNHAIHFDTKEEKLTTQIGIAEFFLNRCIVETENTDCGACSEHCPTQAVHMELYKEGSTLTVPVVEPELCIGCGGCESICPVRPNKAIIIKSNLIHQTVNKPEEEETLDIQIDSFGF